MSKIKTRNKKIRLSKKNRQTKWAPFWTVPKKYGAGRRIHPGRHTSVKRNWRRTKINA